ncbi:MAG: hypothetical protein FWE42_08735 [Defluviitaleaceae bacterium]|nr:hypothetical protein [Defluviitaleaceae bacterium]
MQFAVEKKIADKTALNLPSMRALAKQKGSSRAVTAAKNLAALLPEVNEEAAPASAGLVPSFDEVWPKSATKSETIDDGVEMTIEWSNEEKKYLLFRLVLPDKPYMEYHVVSNAYNDFGKYVGYLRAYPADIGAPYVNDYKNVIRLHWNADKKATVVKNRDDWGKLHELEKGAKEVRVPLPVSLITVLVGLIAQDGDSIYSVTRAINGLVETGQFHAEVVRKAAQTLLQHPAVNPAKLVRVLEKDVALLPATYTILTEGVKVAGEMVKAEGVTPAWLNRILDTALRYAPYLKEAAAREMLPQPDVQWCGLEDIAGLKSKSTAVAKAKKLLGVLI